MIILLNGALGVGKSTLAEALVETLAFSVMLDGDRLLALNPPPVGELEYLHTTIALLVQYHQRHGYRHFVVPYIWRSASEIADLRGRLDPATTLHCFMLTVSPDENSRRIIARARARVLDEHTFELNTSTEERSALAAAPPGSLGVPLDASKPPQVLVGDILDRLGLR